MRALPIAAAVGMTLALAACTPAAPTAPAAPAVEPIAVDAADARGETLTVELDQVLYIDTGDLHVGVEGFTAEIDDESVLEFVPGADAGDFAIYPGFEPVAEGSTRVTLSNEDEDIPPIEFTVEVIRD